MVLRMAESTPEEDVPSAQTALSQDSPSADLQTVTPTVPEIKPELSARWRWLDFAKFTGPGLLACVAFLDPGNLEADIQQGVTAGLTLLWWTALCSLVFGFTYQCIAGRLGLVTGKDLAWHLGERYPRPAAILLWLLIEVAIIAADIQETIGGALALSILSGGVMPLWAGCILVSVTAFGLLLLDRLGFRQLEAVFLSFIVLEAVAMAINFGQAHVPSLDIVKGLFIPQFNSDSVLVAVASLGALIMPYNIFFTSSLAATRTEPASTEARTGVLLRYLRVESFFLLTLAFAINVFVIGVFAQGFGEDPDAQDLGLETAGASLGQRFGSVFQYMWAVGLLAASQVTTIGLTYAGQLVMMGLLKFKAEAGPRMVGTRMIALIPTVTCAVIFETSGTFDTVAQLLNIVQSMMLPFALIPILHVCADKAIMGAFTSHWAVTVFDGLIAGAVTAVNGYLLVQFMQTTLPDTPGILWGWSILIAVYYLVVAYYAIGPDNVGRLWRRGSEMAAKLSAWLRQHHRAIDFQSMMEVHF